MVGVESQVLEHLRPIAAVAGDLRGHMRDVSSRLDILEAQSASLSGRFGRPGERVGRIERQLDLMGA